MAAILTVDFQNCFILIILCFLSFLYYSVFLKKSKNGSDLPPIPPSLPIIGHLHLLLSVLPHKAFQKISSKYGPLLYLRIFNIPIILVSSASVAYEIYRTQDVNVSSRGISIMEDSLLFGPETFSGAPYGDYVKFMKKLLVRNLFGTQAIEQSRAKRADVLERFYVNLVDKARKNKSIEIHKEASKLSNNNICKLLMGRSCSEENGEAGRVRDSVNKINGLLRKIVLANMLREPLKKLGISLFEKEITGVSKEFDELIERNLLEHEEKLEEHHQAMDMTDVLLAACRDENAEYKITKKHIKLLFVEILLAGTDSAAQTIQWAMAEIFNKPNILERLREEIDSVLGKKRLIQETDLPRLAYLQAVVKETLRLHPPAPLIIRMFEEECKVGGFFIPDKATLVVNVYAVMRDPNIWEDPDEFKPERFLGEDAEKALKFLPFGSGRRGCPGVNIGYIFVGTAVGMMVQCFDWRIKGDKVVNLQDTVAGMTLTMAYPPSFTHLPRIDPLNLNLQIPSSYL